MKLLFATGNSFKLDLMKKRLSVFEDLEIVKSRISKIEKKVELQR